MTLTLDELAADPECGSEDLADNEARIRRAVLTIGLAGRATISALPLRVGRADQERPRVWSVARAEAASAQPWITTLRHGAVPANPILRVLLPHLDGTNDRVVLCARLVEALMAGALRVQEFPADQALPSPDRLREVAEQYVEQVLHHLERNALLEAGAGDANQTTGEM
jgi:PKMT, C-terminal winged helix domain